MTNYLQNLVWSFEWVQIYLSCLLSFPTGFTHFAGRHVGWQGSMSKLWCAAWPGTAAWGSAPMAGQQQHALWGGWWVSSELQGGSWALTSTWYPEDALIGYRISLGWQTNHLTSNEALCCPLQGQESGSSDIENKKGKNERKKKRWFKEFWKKTYPWQQMLMHFRFFRSPSLVQWFIHLAVF